MTTQEANDYLVRYIKEKSGITLRPQEVRYFGLVEPIEETERDIEQYADDYLSEIETEDAEYRATAQDRYNDQHEYQIVQSERYEQFRNEY